ncbi:MAG: hypothetical protein ACE5KM_16960 [Planctomycetaceae bacterium]
MAIHRCVTVALVFAGVATAAHAEDKKIFSGPQVGEKLPPLKVKGVFGKEAGKEFDFVKLAKGKPTVLIFMHKLTRPAFGTVRALLNYAGHRKPDELFSAMIYLSDDATEGEKSLKRLGRYLQIGKTRSRFGLSPDGKEGPGAYGLNRNVTLTILVADKGKVTASYPLVQPSVQADVMKIIKDVVALTGQKTPKLEDIFKRRYAGKKKKKRGPQRDPVVKANIRAFIQKDATAKEVDAVAKKIEDRAKKEPKAKRDIAFFAGVILRQGYGTKRAREIAKRWRKEYGAKNKPKKKD